jgi:hypothetical protein
MPTDKTNVVYMSNTSIDEESRRIDNLTLYMMQQQAQIDKLTKAYKVCIGICGSLFMTSLLLILIFSVS